MAIAFRDAQTSSTGASAAASLVITKPVGLADGDVIIVAMQVRITTSPKPTNAHSFLDLADIVNAGNTNCRTSAFYKVITSAAGEPASYTFSVSPNAHMAGGAAAYSGVDTTTPIDVTASTSGNANSTSCTAASITPPSANVLLGFIGGAGGGTVLTAFTPPASMSTRERWDVGNSSSSVCSCELADEDYNNAGVATGTRVATLATGQLNNGMLFALRPLSGGSPVTISVPTATATADAQIPILLGLDVDPGVPIGFGPTSSDVRSV